MSKKLFPAFLLLTFAALFFGCSNGEPDKGSAPVLNEVFFFNANDATIATTNKDLLDEYKTTEMNIFTDSSAKTFVTYGIYFNITDVDCNPAYILISWDNDKYYSLNDNELGSRTSKNSEITCFKHWYENDVTEGPLYFKIRDSMDNLSNTFTVNAKIIDNSASTN